MGSLFSLGEKEAGHFAGMDVYLCPHFGFDVFLLYLFMPEEEWDLCIHWGKRNLVTLLARTCTCVHILDLMFFYSTCSCQRRSGIFDCGTPWKSFHCFLDFCGQLFIMPSNEVLNPGTVLKRLFMYETSFNHKTTKRPITT